HHAAAGGASTRLSTALPIARPGKQEQGVFTLDLPTLRATPGDAVELRFRAEDRAGQFDLSSPLRLKVVATGATAPTAAAPPAPIAPAAATTPRVEASVPIGAAGVVDGLSVALDAVRGGSA